MNIPFSSILITVVAGFIGSHISDRLVGEGLEVGVLDNFVTGSWANVTGRRGLHVHRGDVADPAVAEKVVKFYEVIVHQAALIGNAGSAGPSRVHDTITLGL